jgi:hypothetical protein
MTDTRTMRGKKIVREMLGEGFLKAMEGHVDSAQVSQHDHHGGPDRPTHPA